MNTKKIIIFGLGFAALAGLAAGQVTPLRERQKMRQNILTLRLLRLTQALDLSEEQAAKIFPTFNRIEKEKLGIQKTVSADIFALRQLLQKPEAEDEGILARLQSLKGAQAALRAKDDELDRFIEAGLNPVQKAKYVLFQIEFYRGLTDILDRAGGLRRGQMGAVPPGPIKK